MDWNGMDTDLNPSYPRKYGCPKLEIITTVALLARPAEHEPRPVVALEADLPPASRTPPPRQTRPEPARRAPLVAIGALTHLEAFLHRAPRTLHRTEHRPWTNFFSFAWIFVGDSGYFFDHDIGDT